MQMLHTYLQWLCIHILAVHVYAGCAGADAAHILAVETAFSCILCSCSACVCSVSVTALSCIICSCSVDSMCCFICIERESARARASLSGNKVHNGGSWARPSDRRCTALCIGIQGKACSCSGRDCFGPIIRIYVPGPIIRLYVPGLG